MQTKITRDGKKNTVMMVWGEGPVEQTVILGREHLQDNPTGIKLDQIQYACESGVKVRFGWTEDGLVLPVEGRGLLNYYQFDSLQPSSQNQSLWLEVSGEGAFHLVLDCTKMGI